MVVRSLLVQLLFHVRQAELEWKHQLHIINLFLKHPFVLQFSLEVTEEGLSKDRTVHLNNVVLSRNRKVPNE